MNPDDFKHSWVDLNGFEITLGLIKLRVDLLGQLVTR